LRKKAKSIRFFYFIEYVLVKLWEKIYSLNDYSYIDKFDDLHDIYVDSLEQWMESISTNEYGLWDENSKESLELIFYPLRTFDVIRRVSYLGYKYLLYSNEVKARSCVDKLLQIIISNRSSGTPLCESNYNDIGLALCVLYLTHHNVEARLWLYNLVDFLVFHYTQGYSTVPLEAETQEVYGFLFKRDSPKVQITSHLMLLFFEFAGLLNASEVFETFRLQLPARVSCYELVMLANESIIYGENVIDAIETEIESLEMTMPYFKVKHEERIRQWQKSFSPIVHKRPLILVLLSNIHRDRYFPEIWRHVLYDNI
jgi:hypothetical protein